MFSISLVYFPPWLRFLSCSCTGSEEILTKDKVIKRPSAIQIIKKDFAKFLEELSDTWELRLSRPFSVNWEDGNVKAIFYVLEIFWWHPRLVKQINKELIWTPRFSGWIWQVNVFTFFSHQNNLSLVKVMNKTRAILKESSLIF